ncbi:hypothetical protein BROUX41_000596 [Berkeleyomyces rouxiae]|uniref:uncharacterized protein n=1 Tax=Berkeleyomyces rouxiae TaxID=2035830 RepID=UPI003B8102CC
MPQSRLPLTPSSTEIRGKDDISQITCLQIAFELPPPAIHNAEKPTAEPSEANMSSFSTAAESQSQSNSKSRSKSHGISMMTAYTYPIQPSETVKSCRRAPLSSSKSAGNLKNAFTLPPPPTLSRKIIQMKPKTSSQDTARPSKATPQSPTTKGVSADSTATDTNAASAESASEMPADAAPLPKKKQTAAANAVAGRKQARKTAHSLIERRRRSKMNEEFAVLKNMIPACTGEMHKLAILQASIEYVRYLEDCVSKLKAQQEASADAFAAGSLPLAAFDLPQSQCQEDYDDDNENDEDNDPSACHKGSSVANDIDMVDTCSSVASTSTADYRCDSYVSSTTSPAFEPQQYSMGPGFAGTPGIGVPGYATLPNSALTSPALYPQRDARGLDHEATAALLMRNSDRRGEPETHYGHAGGQHQSAGSARGMSVRDLLSS